MQILVEILFTQRADSKFIWIEGNSLLLKWKIEDISYCYLNKEGSLIVIVGNFSYYFSKSTHSLDIIRRLYDLTIQKIS